MRVGFYFLLLIAGLSGCASRNPGRREQLYSSTDSTSYTRLDTSCLHYNRGVQLQGWSRLKEVSRTGSDQEKNESDCLVGINSWFDHFNQSGTKIAIDKIDTFLAE